MFDLPSIDKLGNHYLSYSQISCFLKDKEEYKKRYILKEPFIGNKYTEFGVKVGNALMENDYSLFKKSEKNVLEKCTRLDLFERKTILKYDNFYIIGFIDTCTSDLSKIIDYKTGGAGKELEYKKDNYTQLVYYALSIRQEIGITPKEASVEFITRAGNAFRGECLVVDSKEPIKINIDLSESRLKQVYWDTIQIAKNISEFYLDNKK